MVGVICQYTVSQWIVCLTRPRLAENSFRNRNIQKSNHFLLVFFLSHSCCLLKVSASSVPTFHYFNAVGIFFKRKVLLFHSFTRSDVDLLQRISKWLCHLTLDLSVFCCFLLFCFLPVILFLLTIHRRWGDMAWHGERTWPLRHKSIPTSTSVSAPCRKEQTLTPSRQSPAQRICCWQEEYNGTRGGGQTHVWKCLRDKIN